MGLFQSSRTFPIVVPDLAPVVQDVIDHFEQQGYEVKSEQNVTQGWDISIRKGSQFKAVLGMKTALKVQIEPSLTVTTVTAGIGIFGLQAIPTVISMLIFWPVLVTQIWGMVKQARLDEESLNCVEANLKKHSSTPLEAAATKPETGAGVKFCTTCGAQLPTLAKFCSECGTKQL